jgi:hypothetical protein
MQQARKHLLDVNREGITDATRRLLSGEKTHPARRPGMPSPPTPIGDHRNRLAATWPGTR